MDPLTLAVATFGIQKLRGKSTGRALRDAAFIAGGTQLLGMGGVGPFRAFGSTGFGGGGSFLAGDTLGQQMSQSGIGSLLGRPKMTPEQAKIGISEELGTPMNQITQQQIKERIASSGTGIRGFTSGLTGGQKLVGAAAAAPLVGSLFAGEEEFELPEGVRPEDYEKAREEAQQQVAGIGTRAVSTQAPTYSYPYQYNQGGIVNALPKYNQGGINYLPSKVDHDENDANNYVRAGGYVEDGSGNGNKDEDTMLAQLADGEFVSRADAILGAGILEGASPKDMKDMRKKGAAFFYDQQAKFKRVFDLLNASRKDN